MNDIRTNEIQTSEIKCPGDLLKVPSPRELYLPDLDVRGEARGGHEPAAGGDLAAVRQIVNSV